MINVMASSTGCRGPGPGGSGYSYIVTCYMLQVSTKIVSRYYANFHLATVLQSYSLS